MTTSPRLVRTAAALIATLALAGCATGTTVTVEDPWVRSNPNGMGAVYMVLIPFEVAELLMDRVGLRREDLVGLSRADAIARLIAYWTTGR